MTKKSGLPLYHDPADGPLTPEQIAENVRMSVDSLAALNLAFDMDMSATEALVFVQKNRRAFEAVASAIVEDQSIADAARSIKAITSANNRNAAMKPRSKRNATCRSVTIEAMTTARKSDQTLSQFLDAAAIGSIERLAIEHQESVGVQRYIIDADDVAEGSNKKRVAHSTIEEWWATAGRRSHTD